MPRIDVVETEVFKFDELTEEAKQSAIENLYDINVDYEWWEYTYEDAIVETIQCNAYEFTVEGKLY